MKGGLEERGPLPKAKRRSLKVESQPMKKEEGPPRWTEVSLRGRRRSNTMAGKMARNLDLP